VRSQAWYTYAKANNVTGIIQHAFQVYKTKQSTTLDPDLLELLSKSDAFGQDLFKKTIRQIQLAEPHFDSASIQRWIADGKLDAAHAPLFVQLAIEEPPKRKANGNA
jgi:hypothetical protein